MAAATLWRMRWDDDMEPAIALAREAAADGEVRSVPSCLPLTDR